MSRELPRRIRVCTRTHRAGYWWARGAAAEMGMPLSSLVFYALEAVRQQIAGLDLDDQMEWFRTELPQDDVPSFDRAVRGVEKGIDEESSEEVPW